MGAENNPLFRKETPWTSMMKTHNFGSTLEAPPVIPGAPAPVGASPASPGADGPKSPLNAAAATTSPGGDGSPKTVVNNAKQMQVWLKVRTRPHPPSPTSNRRRAKATTTSIADLSSIKTHVPEAHVNLEGSTADPGDATPRPEPPPVASRSQGSPPEQSTTTGASCQTYQTTHSVKREQGISAAAAAAHQQNKFKHARKDSPFEVWIPPSQPKKQRVGGSQGDTQAFMAPRSQGSPEDRGPPQAQHHQQQHQTRPVGGQPAPRTHFLDPSAPGRPAAIGTAGSPPPASASTMAVPPMALALHHLSSHPKATAAMVLQQRQPLGHLQAKAEHSGRPQQQQQQQPAMSVGSVIHRPSTSSLPLSMPLPSFTKGLSSSPIETLQPGLHGNHQLHQVTPMPGGPALSTAISHGSLLMHPQHPHHQQYFYQQGGHQNLSMSAPAAVMLDSLNIKHKAQFLASRPIHPGNPMVLPKTAGAPGRAPEQQSRCSCKRTKCLKMYCPCFANGLFCGPKCNCHDCRNDVAFNQEVLEARKRTKNKTPDAFEPKIRFSTAKRYQASHQSTQQEIAMVSSHQQGGVAIRQHQRGCRCVKTNCLKRYCECFAAGVFCGTKCSCSNCHNNEEYVNTAKFSAGM